MFQTPILFLIFNRPDLTSRVFEQIRLIKPTKLYVAADGPRQNKMNDLILCKEAREIIAKNIDWDCTVNTLFSNDNLGCKLAVSGALNWFFEQEPEGIILEDDTLPDISFFLFCEHMLERYRHNEKITHISGTNFMGEFSNLSRSYFYSKVWSSWGWASWQRAWQHYDADMKNWPKKKTKKTVKLFLDNPIWYKIFERDFNSTYHNQINTWDFQWMLTNILLNGLSVIPSVNLIENIGFREDATHTLHKDEHIEKIMFSRKIQPPFIPSVDVCCEENYRAYYLKLFVVPDSPFIEFVKKVKRKLLSILKKLKNV